MTTAEPLPSWTDRPARTAIVEFVRSVTEPGDSFVSPPERIAAFDNDGTLWLEKPAYIQVLHGLRAVARIAAERPELRDRQPFRAAYENDEAWLGAVAADYATDSGEFRALAAGFSEGWEGMAVEDFEADALEFLSTTRDARFDRPYMQLTYRPMVELVHYLQSAGFDVYLSSGGGRDFMRAVCEEIYGIPRAMAIGSSVTFAYAEDARGVAQVVRTREIEQPADDGTGKPVHLHRAIGRRPIVAAGNSDGDIQLLKYASGHPGLTLGLLVHHDDAQREYAYDGGAEKALRLAATQGWIVVSMRDDWKTVFAED